jgi:CRP/FNR family cyclic AMP-dependent transcriptional regulator
VKVTAETLKVIKLFSDLGLEQRQQLAGRMVARKFAARQAILTQGDMSDDVYFLLSGNVRASMYAPNGKEVSCQELAAGEMFGELAAIAGKPRTTYVVALNETQVLTLGRQAFIETLLDGCHSASIVMHTLSRLESLIGMLLERYYEISTLGVQNRIHAELLRLAVEQSPDATRVEIQHPPTHAQIASRVATHREAVTRECKELEKMGVIDWHPGSHVIHDVPKLAKMVEHVRGH